MTDLHFEHTHTYIYIYIYMVPIGSPLGCSKYRFWNVLSIGFGYVLSTDFYIPYLEHPSCAVFFSKVCSKYKPVAIHIYIYIQSPFHLWQNCPKRRNITNYELCMSPNSLSFRLGQAVVEAGSVLPVSPAGWKCGTRLATQKKFFNI